MYNIVFCISSKAKRYRLSILLNFAQDIMSFYAVAKGRNPGIYFTWNECKAEVHQFSGPIYKKFHTKSEAEEFIKQHSSSSYSTSSSGSKNSVILKHDDTLNLFKKSVSQAKYRSLKRSQSSDRNSDNGKPEHSNKKQKNEPSLQKNKNGFLIDENGFTEVYTDGACTFNGRGNAKAGIGIWFSEDNSLNVSQPVVGRATNNMAEIQAVTIAARQAQKAGVTKLKINTDSQFLISCITQWMPKWKKCGWKNSSGHPVINKTELIEMEKALEPIEVLWNHVRGHVGIHGNEMADKLARDGSERYCPDK